MACQQPAPASGKGDRIIALCDKGKGCDFISVKDADELPAPFSLSKGLPPNEILVLEKCASTVIEYTHLGYVDSLYGGDGKDTNITQIDYKKYLKDNNCLHCPNETKKISYAFIDKNQNIHGNSYMYINLKQNEAFIPNDAYQMMNNTGDEVVIDSWIRNNTHEQYIIVRDKKTKMSMPFQTMMFDNGKTSPATFSKLFKSTGKTRSSSISNRKEAAFTVNYSGQTFTFWFLPVDDVCLDANRMQCIGMHQIGYYLIDGITYLTSEIDGAEFNLKVTNVAAGTYNFNPVGYATH